VRNQCYRQSYFSLVNLFKSKSNHMNFLKLFGVKSKKEKISEAMAKGAIIIDVRTAGEYKSGHIKNSINIPLDVIGKKADELARKNKPVITCCRSGMRSQSAAMTLKAKGIEVINGGAWTSLNSMLK
jgi:phage shock protein E